MSRTATIAGSVFLLAKAMFGAGEPLAVRSARCVDNGKNVPCHLQLALIVTVDNLDAWVKTNDPSKLILALNGHVLKGLRTEPPIAGKNEIQFELERTADNRDVWNVLLSRLHFSKTAEHMSVSVGVDGQDLLYGQGASIGWKLLPDTPWVVAAFGILGVMTGGFLYLVKVSNIIRDPAPGLADDEMASYSLARSQMAWWFFLVLIAYVYIWIISGDMDTITDGVLILTGISAGAGVGSMIVDSGKEDSRKALTDENSALTEVINGLQDQIGTAPPNVETLKATLQQKRARQAEIATALSKLPSALGKSEGFLKDILRGDDGVEFHRFQMAAWTVVLGFVFIREVYGGLAMPDFSTTLLSLMGISSGTYLGFKIPDSQR